MPKPSEYLKWSAILTGAAVVIFIFTVGYYWITTPAASVVIYADDFPAVLSIPFSSDALIDRVAIHLNDMITTADSGVLSDLDREEGVVPRSIPQPIIPIRASSNISSPVFTIKWKGLALNLARGLGIGLKSKRFLDIQIIGISQSGWRLVAATKDRPDYVPQTAGSAPRTGGPCLDVESCANDLAEQILKRLDSSRLLRYYIKLNTEDGNRRILELYESTVPTESLRPDDFVTWGNTYYALHRFNDALGKYQEALQKDGKYCPAHIGRGLVYYSRPHATQRIADLKLAEQDFRLGVACDSNNKFAQTDLCSTLLREWTNSDDAIPKPSLLSEALIHCNKALDIDHHFVAAAVPIGYILYRQGQHEQALRFFARINRDYPPDSSLFLNYGFLLYLEYLNGKKDALDKAIDTTLQSWGLNKSYGAANNLGFFYYEAGEYRKAIDFWKQANLLRGNAADSLAGLALALDKDKQEQDALSLVSQAVDLDSHYRNPDYLKKHDYWSERAALDLSGLISRLPTKSGIAP